MKSTKNKNDYDFYTDSTIQTNKTKPEIQSVIIACCTYKRPNSLDRTIKSLLKLNYPSNIKTEIVIVDNDKDQSAQDIVKKHQTASEIQIHYTIEENPGLSNVRNKALEHSLNLNATHLAFIDDDEIADENWLINHIDFYNQNNEIYISSGPTYARFEKDYPKYITENNVFKTSTTKKNGLIRKNCASGNVFFPLNIVKDYNLRFLEEYNLLGGEDGAFFGAMSDLGFKIGWNLNAINYEMFGDERANVVWILRRKFHNGYSGSLVRFRKDKKIHKRLFYIFEKAITIVLNIILSVFSIILGKTCLLNCVGITFINFGKLMGATLLKPINYYQKREGSNG